ncbi:putative metalloendopeptidase OMA1, mitochondrial isoform X2 [Apostichopus japonicus]|uniref:Metalloendopeptidase OMA1, mitochondrial n=1 Tax=Stichopus japonicus TaxID=307972 RepID=A0A2G8KMB5_STIJA|nr:putative metalloendopeptidase OMA1, mitochondrial isoform X2 [Apostichopus japonicus]
MLIIVRAFRHSCSLGRVNQLHTQSKLISNIELHCRSGIAKGTTINGNVRGLQTSQTLLSGIRCLSQRSIQHQLILIRRQPQECSIRWFHRSQRHQAQPLLLLMVFKSIAKISAVISGRAFRKWRTSLPQHKSESITETVKRNVWKIAGAVASLFGLGLVYYYSHIEQTPITNRKRFLALNSKQLADVIEVEYEQHLKDFEGLILPTSHPLHEVVERITTSLLKGNQDLHQIRDKTWTIHVVNKDIKNAFVLPAEQISLFEFLDLFMIIVLGGIWAILPNDGLAIVATWFKNKVVELLLTMPYSRLLETEADEVGLQLAAKACLDVRESQVFWETMSRNSPVTEDLVFLSTHPTHSQRAKHLEELIPQAIRVREYCGCAPLPIRDPRTVEANTLAEAG